MATSPASLAPGSQFPPLPLPSLAEPAVFTLASPIKASFEGMEIELYGFDMRALAQEDCELLDRFRGQPIALAQNLIAALCDLTIDQVRQLGLEDFAMLAGEVIFQVEQLSTAMGLAPDLFWQSAPALGGVAIGDA